jgi:hypothetical protein
MPLSPRSRSHRVRKACANSGYSQTVRRTGQVDPSLTFEISPMNSREARESRLWRTASVAPRAVFPQGAQKSDLALAPSKGLEQAHAPRSPLCPPQPSVHNWRDNMSSCGAARHYAISESVAVKWLGRVERLRSRELVRHGGHRASKLMPHRDFMEPRAGREIGPHTSGSQRSSLWPSTGQKPTPERQGPREAYGTPARPEA